MPATPPPTPARSTSQPAGWIALAAIWLGLATGFGEVALRWLVQNRILGIPLFYSPHFVWMAPLAEGLLFGTVGGLLVVATRLWPRVLPPARALTVPVFLAFLTLALMIPGLHPLAAGLVAAGFAVHAARFLRRQPVFPRLVRRTVLPLAAVVLALAIGVHAWQALAERRALAAIPEPAPESPNVLLIVLDTVRAQSLSLYGHERATSPELDRFARGGATFDNALTTASWTSPSHYSLMTGRFPHELITHWKAPLDGRFPTLAEALGGRGYATAGFVANMEYAGYETGLARGFSHYEDYPVSLGELVLSSSLAQAVVNNQTLRVLAGDHQILGRKDAPDVNAQFLGWLDGRQGRPFFAFLNYFDAHEVYLPPEPFDERFGSLAVRDESHVWHFKRRAKIPNKLKKQMSPEQLEAEERAYDASIAYLDHHVGRLFEALRARGVLENTLVIVTSDHGEQFGEHGLFDHGNSLYRQLLHVPLVVVMPGRVPAGARVPGAVSLRDVPATVMHLLGPGGATPLPGSSLARHWSGTRPLTAAPVPPLAEFARVPREAVRRSGRTSLVSRIAGLVRQGLGIESKEKRDVKVRMKSLVAGGFHYIRNGDGREELYDFASDPDETRDLSAVRGEQLARLRGSVDAILTGGPPDGDRTLETAEEKHGTPVR